MWTGKFDLNTLRVDRNSFDSGKKKSCGLKNIRMRVDRALVDVVRSCSRVEPQKARKKCKAVSQARACDPRENQCVGGQLKKKLTSINSKIEPAIWSLGGGCLVLTGVN